MIEHQYMMVDFAKCKDCIHWDSNVQDDPCNECLGEPINLDSDRPIHYKPKDEEK